MDENKQKRLAITQAAMELMMGLEPMTSSLPRKCSTS